MLGLVTAGADAAELSGDATGLAPSGVVCRNVTSGQRVVSSTASADWDCAALGLLFGAGDRAETGVRGVLAPAEKVGELRFQALPDEFVEHIAVVDSEIDIGGAIASDLDSDGDIDILVSQAPLWFENLGGSDPAFVKHAVGGDILTDSIYFTRVLDVNQDERLDIIASVPNSGSTRRLSWFRNDGADPPSFNERLVDQEQGWTFDDGNGADIDADGDTDFFVIKEQRGGCGQCSTEIIWLENTGSAYIRHLIDSVSGNGSGRFRLFSEDVDGDNDPDLLVADRTDDVLTWWENEGAAFTQEHVIEMSYSVLDLRQADVDGDGDIDLVTKGTEIGTDDLYRWFESLGNGDFVPHPLDAFPGHILSDMAVGDFSGDGRPDIVVSDFPEAAWLENDGMSPPGFEEHPLTFSSDPRVGSAGDIDQDGRLDLVKALSDELTWYENRIGLRLSVTGLAVRDFLCRNRTTGQRLRVTTAETEIDCENEGLVVNPGDEIEVFARGTVE